MPACADKPEPRDVVTAGYGWWPLSVQFKPTDQMPPADLSQLFAVITSEIQAHLGDVLASVAKDKYLTAESKAVIEGVLATRMRELGRGVAAEPAREDRAGGEQPPERGALTRDIGRAGAPSGVGHVRIAVAQCRTWD